ncbi:restriction endonuclease subunit S [Corynebacterium belfantii]|uniref:restriction endonuclease subunit S n=1 Tax=Corynebacterium belfantii TaxID=2014537 RepID=UPI0018D43C47|nr:restriction endonuclease subunit S [Corynebacterium belfantii]MBG9333455.1 restriction endonuclease subunit S [Corynebacterium belfantii]
MSWEQKTLGELLETLIDHRGRTPKKLGTDFVANGVPVLSAQLVTNGFIDWSNTRFVDQQTFELWMPQKLKKSDVLLTSEAPLGRTAILNREQNVVLGQRLFALRGKRGVLDNHYLHYWLRSDKGQAVLTSHAQGTTVIGIRQSSLRSISVDLPSITTQKAIADVLGALDDKIAANQRVLELGSLLLREKYQTFCRGNLIPFEVVAFEGRDKIHPSLVSGDTPQVSLEHFGKKSLWLKRWGQSSEVESTKSQFRRGDLLFGKLRPYFHKVSVADVDGICSTDVLVIRAKDDRHQMLVALAANSDAVVDQAVMNSNGTRMPRAKWQDIAKCAIPNPKRADVQEFCDAAKQVFQLATKLIFENQVLAATRDELLPLLMNGKITVAEAKEAAGDVGVVKQNQQEEGDGSV